MFGSESIDRTLNEADDKRESVLNYNKLWDAD